MFRLDFCSAALPCGTAISPKLVEIMILSGWAGMNALRGEFLATEANTGIFIIVSSSRSRKGRRYVVVMRFSYIGFYGAAFQCSFYLDVDDEKWLVMH